MLSLVTKENSSLLSYSFKVLKVLHNFMACWSCLLGFINFLFDLPVILPYS